MHTVDDSTREIDPDPFSLGLALFSALAGGGAFLETRRGRRRVEAAERRRLAAAWYAARRSLIAFRGALDEFETYMREDAYEDRAFRIGAVRLSVDGTRKQQMLDLIGRSHTTAAALAADFDGLSDYLGEEDQRMVDAVLRRLDGAGRQPRSYVDLVRGGREALASYERLLDHLAAREGIGGAGPARPRLVRPVEEAGDG